MIYNQSKKMPQMILLDSMLQSSISLFFTTRSVDFVLLGAIVESTLHGVLGISSNFGCPRGPYDPKCRKNCNGTCSVCDSNDECLNCTKPGLQLPECTKPCFREYFGLNCKQRCNLKCLNRACDSKGGDCLDCRDVGYRLPTCTSPCTTGTYGRNCQEQCPTVCKNNCDRRTGFCFTCHVGKGPHCSVNCLFDINNSCDMYCPLNCVGWCNATTKECSLCSPGFKVPHCTEHCDTGTYGSQCALNCPIGCKGNVCHHITGECVSCIDGYVGRWCNGKCIDGLYGSGCRYTCSSTCFDQLCQHDTGHCVKCLPGYTGHFCDILCDEGKYGDECSMLCPTKCLWPCDPITGECVHCLRGYHGSKCISNCSNNLKRLDQFLISLAIITIVCLHSIPMKILRHESR